MRDPCQLLLWLDPVLETAISSTSRNMYSLRLQLEHSNHGLIFSAFFANGKMMTYDEGFTRNGSEGIDALAYLCVCHVLHSQSELKGKCTLIPSDSNCKKLAKALSNKPKWLNNLNLRFPKRTVIENHGVTREPRISLQKDISVVVEIISHKGQREARYSELQLFKEQCIDKPHVTSLSIEVLPCQGGDRRILQQSEERGGVVKGDLLWIRAATNRKAYFILLWINGDGEIQVLYPETSLQIPAIIELGDQKSAVLLPSKSGLKISSASGHEICVSIVLSNDSGERDLRNAIDAVKHAVSASRRSWSIESSFIYSAARNMNFPHCFSPTTNELGLQFSETGQNPAADFLENLTVKAISARVIIIPNITNQRDRDTPKAEATDGN